jgi:hypothetical protein
MSEKSPIVARKLGPELKVGDVVRTWFGDQPIVQLLAYKGPFDFICSIACFPGRTGTVDMSIEKGMLYELTLAR